MMRKKRTLVPRTLESNARAFEVGKDIGRSLVPQGDFSINPHLRNVRFDRLRCYRAGKTVLRIWPMLDPEDPNQALLNGRLSSVDVAGLSGMAISEPAYCVQYAGIHKDSGGFLASGDDAAQCSYIIARNKNSVTEGVGFWDEPYVKLYVTAKRARDAGKFGHGGAWDASWNSLMSGEIPALGGFKQRYFAVCSVLENGPSLDLVREHVEYRKGGKDIVKDYPRNGIPLGDATDDPLVVLQLPISAGKKIFQLACVAKDAWEGNVELNPSLMYKYGDPTGIFDAVTGTVKGGVFFTLYNPEKVTIASHTTFKGVIAPQVTEYEAAVTSRYAGPNGQLTPDLNKDQVDNILNKQVFLWRDSPNDPVDSYLLHEPSIEERCLLLSKAFQQVPSLLKFCWMSHPNYLTFDSVQSVLKARRVVSVVTPALEDEPEDEPAEAPRAKLTSSIAKVKVSQPVVDEFEDDDLAYSPVVKPTVSGKKSAAVLVDEFDDEGEVEADVPAPKVRARVRPAPAVAVDDEESGKSDDFDDEADTSDVETRMTKSLASANALARGRKRTSEDPQPEAPVVARPRARFKSQ